MSVIIIVSTLSAVSLAGVVAAVRSTLRDGYGRVPNRTL